MSTEQKEDVKSEIAYASPWGKESCTGEQMKDGASVWRGSIYWEQIVLTLLQISKSDA
jgi:hypothetical protein